MKRSFYIAVISLVALLLGGCDTIKGLHGQYQSQATVPTDVYGEGIDSSGDSTSLAALSWRQFFTDPLLQQLIDTALVRNTDINSARIAVQQSQPLPSRRFSRRSSSHPRVPSQPMAAVQQSRPITCRCRSIGISTHLVPSRAINASRRHFSCKPQSLNKPSRPTSSRPWLSSTAPCLCWTSNWRFSWLPTVCGTSRLRPRRFCGKMASPIQQPSIKWSLPT